MIIYAQIALGIIPVSLIIFILYTNRDGLLSETRWVPYSEWRDLPKRVAIPAAFVIMYIMGIIIEIVENI